MAAEELATYLNDHVAGAVGALELVAHLALAETGTDRAAFFSQLHVDISSDREELGRLMARLGFAESVPRKTAAWFGEKLAELKLRVDSSPDGGLHLLESLETVSLGIEGKRGLWKALRAASESEPGLQGLDYDRLEQRAAEQRERVEKLRLEVAKSVLG
jgi:hypothetical protein